MEIKAFIRFKTFSEFSEFLNLKDFDIYVEAAYPELRTISVLIEGCDDE